MAFDYLSILGLKLIHISKGPQELYSHHTYGVLPDI